MFVPVGRSVLLMLIHLFIILIMAKQRRNLFALPAGKPNWVQPTPANLANPNVKHVTNVNSGKQGYVSISRDNLPSLIQYVPLPKGLSKVVAAGEAWNNIAPPHLKITKENVGKVFSGRINKGNSEQNVMNSSYALSKAPNPKPVYLNSGIVPNTYANEYMTPKENLCAPLHMSICNLNISSTPGNVIREYFLSNTAFDIQTRAQANVNFSVDVTSTLSASSLNTAFNAGIRALHVYYFYASILSYESDPRNKNPGMIALRALITPQLMSDLTSLGRRLEDTPLPPRLVQWVRYMNMNFLSGDSQGAPLLKIGCDPLCYSAPASPSLAALALTDLITWTPTFSLLRRAIPQWRIGKLYDVPVTPVFDKNFLTIFANAPAVFYSGSYYNYPSVASADTAINYNSFNNRLDGAAYAMCCINDGSSWTPGFLTPMALTTRHSRISYYAVSGVAGFYSSFAQNYLAVSRPESYQSPATLPGSPLTIHLPGADKCQGVTVNSVGQTAINFLDFLVDVDSIPVNGKLNSFNRNGRNKV